MMMMVLDLPEGEEDNLEFIDEVSSRNEFDETHDGSSGSSVGTLESSRMDTPTSHEDIFLLNSSVL